MTQTYTTKQFAKHIFIFILSMSITCLSAQMLIDDSLTPTEMVDILVGDDITVSNIVFTGSNVSRGSFSGGPGNIGISEGIILTSGRADIAPGPNNTESAGFSNSSGGDPDLSSISGGNTQDACILEFDFVTSSNIIMFEYIFASEEYLEFVGLYNDVFAFLISGPGINGPYSNNSKNIALIPGTSIPVSINSVNDVQNPSYFILNNQNFTQYDGLTVPLFAKSAVQPNQTYHIKLAISDAIDGALDSGVFLSANSFSSSTASNNGPLCEGETIQLTASFTQGATYQWSGPNGFSSTLQNPVITDATIANQGTYTLVITINGDVSDPSFTTVIVYSMPEQYNVTGGGGYCPGDEAIAIGLDDSEIDFTYPLFRGTTLVSTKNGTGNSIEFGYFVTAGVYYAKAVNNGCDADMLGSATIEILQNAQIYDITGGGNICEGDAGKSIGLYDSETGVDYYLYFNGNLIGNAVAGNGNAISFGVFDQPGTYTTKAEKECGLQNMNGSVSITIVPYPEIYDVTGGGEFCEGGVGIEIGLDNSQLDMEYSLYKDGVFISSQLGTANAISFGMQVIAGIYTIHATENQADCESKMNGEAVVIVNELPDVEAGTNVSIPNGTSTTLDATVSNGSGDYTYNWEPSNMLIDPNIEDPTTVVLSSTQEYYLTAIDNITGCEKTDFVIVSITGNALGIGAIASPSGICIGETSTLIPLPSGGSGNYVSYSWTDNNGFTSNLENPIVSPQETTTYYVTVFDGFTSANGEVTVEVYPNPSYSVVENIETYYGTSTQLFCNIDNPEDYTFSWEPEESLLKGQSNMQNPLTQQLTVSQIFTITISDNQHSCQESKDVFITIIGGPLQCFPTASPPEICLGDTIFLYANSQGGNIISHSYSWEEEGYIFSVSKNTFFVPQEPKFYHFTLTVDDGFSTFSNSVNVEVFALPEIQLEPQYAYYIGQDSIMVCLFDTVLVDAENPGSEYLWNNGFNEQYFETYSLGVGYDIQYYSVMVTNTDGCKQTDEITMFFDYNYCVGFDENGNEYSIKLYPNPAKDKVYLHFEGIAEDVNITLYTMDAKPIIQKKFSELNTEGTIKEIDLSYLSAGVYLIRFTNNHFTHTKKIIIQ